MSTGELMAQHSFVTHVKGLFSACPMLFSYLRSVIVCVILALSELNSHAALEGTVVGWSYADDVSIPPDLTNIVAVATGDYQNLAIRSDGTIVGWGGRDLPETPALTNLIQVAVGDRYSLALTGDGQVIAWGTGTIAAPMTNVPSGLVNVKAIAASRSGALALRQDGTVVAWGRGGIVTFLPNGLTNIVGISVNEQQALALRADGTVVGWGDSRLLATVPPGITNAVSVAAGRYHSAILLAHGDIVRWGFLESVEVPQTIRVPGAVQIAAQHFETVALRSDGTLHTTMPLDEPIASKVSGVLALAVGDRTTYVIVAPGLTAPLITKHPVAYPTATGSSMELRVRAAGTGPLAYQWYKDGAPIAGASSNNFSITNSTPSDTGSYHAVVTDQTGTATSRATRLLVADSIFTPLYVQTPESIEANGFGFNLRLRSGSAVRIQASKNLMTWMDLTNFTATSQPFYLLDATATNAPRRFYRTISR